MTDDLAHSPVAASAPAGVADVRPRALSDCVVVVTPRSFGMHDPGLRRRLEAEVGVVRYCPGPLAADALAQAVRDADGLLCGLDHVSRKYSRQRPACAWWPVTVWARTGSTLQPRLVTG
jgi:hypothetical protein